MMCGGRHSGPGPCSLRFPSMTRCPERRMLVRFPVTGMSVSVAVRYRLGTHQGDVVDFNRFGVTIQLPRAIPLNKPLFVTLKYKGLHPEAIVGTAHNIRCLDVGVYRCGIRFRTDSALQLDRDEVVRALLAVEESLTRLAAANAT
jgi:hypothetical protein